MIEDQQTHSLPTQEAALDCVARLDGKADGAALLAALEPVVADVGSCYDRLVAERAVTTGLPRNESGLAAELIAEGFGPPDAALRTLAEWRGGKLREMGSGERSVGKACVSPGRSRWAP